MLVIDDFLIRPLTSDQAADLLEVVEDRAQLRSTVLTSQLPVAEWHEAIGDPTIADAVLDRLLERANRIELVGESLRRGEKREAEKRRVMRPRRRHAGGARTRDHTRQIPGKSGSSTSGAGVSKLFDQAPRRR